MFRIFGYLKNHAKASLRVDVSYPEEIANDGIFKCNWKRLYPNAEEKIPHNAPEPKGKAVRLWGECDADHAHDLETRRSVTGVLIWVNKTLVKWYTKRQSTVETSTYRSEIVSWCRTAVGCIIKMKYSLKMLGIPVTMKEVWLRETICQSSRIAQSQRVH